MARDETYVFDDDNKKKGGFGRFLWNSDTKEFCGRDGASWAKVSFFYAIFYFLLGSFFVGMIAVFVQIMPADRPTYYGGESVMASRGVNPGLGFRPQIDVEDSLVKYSPNILDEASFGFKKYATNIRNFLDAKYPSGDNAKLVKCSEGVTAKADPKSPACEFDHKKIFADTPCSSAAPDSKFGYDSDQACFLIKLNKIVSWVPQPNKTDDDYISIRCGGEFSADKDNLHGVTYHSEGDVNNKDEGKLALKYYPYFNQRGYQAPFVWAQFDVSPNTLVNIDCKIYAKNVDNEDRMNRRGQTKFTLYVKRDKHANE